MMRWFRMEIRKPYCHLEFCKWSMPVLEWYPWPSSYPSNGICCRYIKWINFEHCRLQNSDLISLISKIVELHGIAIYLIKIKQTFLDQISLIILVKQGEAGLFTARILRTFNVRMGRIRLEWAIHATFQMLTLKCKVNMQHAIVNLGASSPLFLKESFFENWCSMRKMFKIQCLNFCF